MGIQEILSMFNSTNTTPVKLDEKLVEYGEVYKFSILQNEIDNISDEWIQVLSIKTKFSK